MDLARTKLAQVTIRIAWDLNKTRCAISTRIVRLRHNESKISPNSRRAGPSFGLIQTAD
jgi:hypothetical protein